MKTKRLYRALQARADQCSVTPMIAGRAAVVLMWTALALTPGCKQSDKARGRYDCSCRFLTDMDDPSVQRVRVCAAADAIEPTAMGCAQSAAPAPIEGCSCKPAAGSCSQPNECTALER